MSLSAIVGASGVKLQRAGREWKGCCPFHPDRTPSFTVYAGDRRFKCFGCGVQGDVIDFLRQAHGGSVVDAIRMLDSDALAPIRTAPTPAASEPEQDRSGEAAAIWREAQPILGTPAEAYLRRRGIRIDLPDCLRFARLRYGTRGAMHPTLVAAIGDPGGSVVGVQRTYLTEEGRKADVAKPKLSLGRIRGGAIRLGPAERSMLVTEGLEDGLTLFQALGRSVWVSAGTSMLPAMLFPPLVCAVVIGADGDEAGEVAAQKAGDSFSSRGLAVRIMRPTAPHKDFNAELMEGAR